MCFFWFLLHNACISSYPAALQYITQTRKKWPRSEHEWENPRGTRKHDKHLNGYGWSVSDVPHLYSLVLVDAEAVHEPQHLLAVLSQSAVVLSRAGLRVQEGSLYGNLQHHPLVLLNLSHREPLGRVQHQHPPDQMLAVWKEVEEWLDIKYAITSPSMISKEKGLHSGPNFCHPYFICSESAISAQLPVLRTHHENLLASSNYWSGISECFDE